MSEFDRSATILAELASLTDDQTAQLASITFRTQDDLGTCRIMRDSIAEEYRKSADTRREPDRYPLACRVGADVAGRGDQFARFAAVYDIGDLRVAADDYDPSSVQVSERTTVADIVADALRVRLSQAAYALLTYLEEDADEKEYSQPDTTSDTESEGT